MKRISLLSLALFAIFILAEIVPAFARMGGGHSYSGGHSSSYGGGGGGYSGGYSSGYSSDLGLFDLIFRIIFAYPIIGIPVTLLIIYILYKSHASNDTYDPGYSSSQGDGQAVDRPLYQNISVGQTLEALKKVDPNFSRAIFMDFVYSLFAQIHTARGKHQVEDYASYFADSVLAGLNQTSKGLSAVEGIVIGSARIYQAKITGTQIEVSIEFQANYTEVAGSSQSWFTVERWTLVRDANKLSRTPEETKVLKCPSCGAPLSEMRNGRCASCGNRNDRGQFDWLVQYRSETRDQREPLLTSDVEEEGTDLPTLYDPDLGRDQSLIPSKQTYFSWESFDARVRFVFLELQKAWTEKAWNKARPYESDSLFQTHYYWISAYERQNMTNVLKNVQIEKVIPVKIGQDRFYSSITVRVYASMLDYTVGPGNKMVSGSTTRPREFSEYWTFIRSHDAPQIKTQMSQCPSCGAPLNINMSGVCEFCKSKITSGKFDWVLSEIEQDEAYAG